MQLIDTHVHINFKAFDEDRDAMMQRAYAENVQKMLHSCCTLEEVDELLAYSQIYDGRNKVDLYAAVGVHPTELHTWDNTSADKIKAILEQHQKDVANGKFSSKRIKAIGETGLDYYHGKTKEEHELQQQVFNEHIEIAKSYTLPLVIHTRDAWEDTLKMIKESFILDRNAKSGVLHCYTGDSNFALECIERGFYVSWSGVVTFRSTEGLRKVAAELPLDRVLIETDCPFLAPQQKRGARNEPSFVNFVAETLADCYGISKEDLVKQTTANAERLFAI